MALRLRRVLKKCRLVLIAAGALASLALLALYLSSTLIPAATKQINLQKSVDRLQSWNKSSRNRLRALCDAQPMIQWSAERQLWIPPVCPYVIIYAGQEPVIMANAKTEKDLRATVKSQLGTDAFHIYVTEPAAFASLTQITGSDYPDKNWPSILLLEQQSGDKFLFKPTGEEAQAAAFSNFLRAATRREWRPFLKQETLDDLTLHGGTSADLAPMHINSDFFETYIANVTARKAFLPEKESFVVFHAPWCGHCRVFLSKFEPLAQQILRVSGKGIGFYKLDVTANDVSDSKFRFNQVPTTIFFSEKSEPIELTERRDVKKGVIDFLKANSRTLRQKDYNEL